MPLPALSEEMKIKYDTIAHIGSERAVLSIALKKPDVLLDICTDIDKDDFSTSTNRYIFEIMMAILDGKYSNVGKVNAQFIMQAVSNSALNEDVSLQYLKSLEDSDYGIENIEYFTDKVKQASIRRESFLTAISVIDEAVNKEDEDIDIFINRQEEKFLDIVMRTNGSDTIVRIGDMIDVVLETRATSPREIMGMPTGFTEYDRQTGGLVPGKLKVFAAAAKVGKSALALNVAINVAIRENIPVLYVDTEMTTEEQLDRMISILATELTGTVVPESSVTRGLYARNTEMNQAVEVARQLIKEAPFYHVYMPDFTPEKVHNIARKFQRTNGITWNGFEKQYLLIFDYIKLPDEASKNPNLNEYQVLGSITNMLKNKTAGILNIPVLAFAQLNPRTTHGADDVNSSHMSGSNRIVMFVNELAFLRRKSPEEINNDGGIENGNLVFKLGESRNGGNYTGWIDYDIRHGVCSMKEVRNVSQDG